MKDEIKEILNKFDKVLENYELDKKWGQMSVDSICHLFPSEMVAIKDYITNLQNTNKNHSKKLIELGDEITNLREENEKLLKKSYSDDVRITKLIEFIEEKISSTKGVVDDYMYHKEHNKILIELLQEDIELYKKELNILQGSDKDE